jgi:chaperonin GroES
MSERLTPLRDRIIVKREPEQEQTAGGIYIPDSAREKSTVGTVVAVGKGKLTEEGKIIPLDVKVGDRILFGKYAGSEAKRYHFESEGEELIVMKEDEVLGVLAGTANPAGSSKKEAAGAKR